MNVDQARAEYLDAMAAASAAFRAAMERPRSRMNRAIREASGSGTQLTREEVAQYVTGTTAAVELYREIMAGPTADLDRALAEAKKAPHDA